MSQTDLNIVLSASQVSSFRIGAIVNSSGTNPLTDVAGWQFGITYNASAFIPQGEPGSASYPDGSAGTALFGSQKTTGTVNWAGMLATGRAFGGSKVCRGGEESECGAISDVSVGEVFVFFARLDPEPSVTISANTLLANVNFELLAKPSGPQSFNITDVVFANSIPILIPRVLAGSSITETISNRPPKASFTATPDTSLDPFAFTFDAAASYDPDGSIPNPAGYFWDFGDGTQDLGVTGSQVIHDYGVNGSFVPTLRVQDSLGATGAARDSIGNIVLDDQPSHTRLVIGSPPVDPPIASFTSNILTPVTNQEMQFYDSSSDRGGSIQRWLWSFGDGSQRSVSERAEVDHYYRLPGNYTVTLTVTDNRGLSANATMIIPVHSRPAHDLAITYVYVSPYTIESSWKAIIYLGITNYSTNDENASVTIYYGSSIIATINGVVAPAGDLRVPCTYCYYTYSLRVVWDTTGIPPGNYTVSATVSLPSDPTLSDNTAGTQIEILPYRASTITVRPSRGSSLVLLRGSNFPHHIEDGSFVRITFDGQQVGLAWVGGSGDLLDFLFLIPPAHAGPHLIEAQDTVSGAKAFVVFHVLPSKTPGNQ